MVNLSSTTQSRKRPGTRQRRPDLSVLRRRQLERFGKYAAQNLKCLVTWHWHNKRSSKDPAWALMEAARRMGRKVTETQALQIIEEAAATFHPMHLSADGPARYIGLSYRDRERLKITVIGACDLTKKERENLRPTTRPRLPTRQATRTRWPSQAQSLSQTRPWEAAGMTRRTWYRKRNGTTSSAAICSYAAEESVPTHKEGLFAALRGLRADARKRRKRTETPPRLRPRRPLFAVYEVIPNPCVDLRIDEATLERYAAAAASGGGR
jgi:hypothetical protein